MPRIDPEGSPLLSFTPSWTCHSDNVSSWSVSCGPYVQDSTEDGDEGRTLRKILLKVLMLF